MDEAIDAMGDLVGERALRRSGSDKPNSFESQVVPARHALWPEPHATRDVIEDTHDAERVRKGKDPKLPVELYGWRRGLPKEA
eukprot:10380602-Alexandrium_andersonii.AAC.1